MSSKKPEFTIYSTNTGEIIGHAICNLEDLLSSLVEGEEFVEGIFEFDRYIYNFETSQMIEKPAVAKSLEERKSEVSEEISNSARRAILSGYFSEALGSKHFYPSKSADQSNMIASVTDSYNPDNPINWTTPFWCADNEEVWGFKEHSAEQIRKAGADGKAAIAAHQLRNAQLQMQIQNATTEEELNLIVW